MYEIIKNIINYEPYNLQEMVKKINTVWVKSEITEEQKDELIQLANEKANPAYSNAEVSKQIEYLLNTVSQILEKDTEQDERIKTIIDKLEEGGTTVPDPTPEPTPEEYPAWVAWDGIQRPIPWQKDSKCTHNGKKWISLVNDNVWEPGAPGTGTVWKEEV